MRFLLARRPATARLHPDAMRLEITGAIEEVVARYEPSMARPALRISTRMRSTLGTYTPGRHEIALSALMLAHADQTLCRGVLLHELAHAITSHRYRRARAHSRLFKDVCREIGADASRLMGPSVLAGGRQPFLRFPRGRSSRVARQSV